MSTLKSSLQPIDTSEQALGIATHADDKPPDSLQGQSRAKRLSTAVEKTVDKLSRSVGGKSALSPSSSPSTRRLFSLSRKVKGHTSAENEGAYWLVITPRVMSNQRPRFIFFSQCYP
jgi:sterol 3beta-glucosyltransferase